MSDSDRSAEDEKCPILITFCPMVIGGFAVFVLKFATENNETGEEMDMKQQRDEKQGSRQQHNMQVSEDHLQLLGTIHEMIDTELDRRGVVQTGRPEHPPPEKASPCRHSLWHSIVKFFIN